MDILTKKKCVNVLSKIKSNAVCYISHSFREVDFPNHSKFHGMIFTFLFVPIKSLYHGCCHANSAHSRAHFPLKKGYTKISHTKISAITHLPNGFALLLFLPGIKCPVCSKFVLPDDIECHLVMCLTKPRLSYNGKLYELL